MAKRIYPTKKRLKRLSRNEKNLRQKLAADFYAYAEKCLKIRAKSGEVTAFEVNRAQRFIHEKIEEQKQKTGRVRALILKGRQQGCSTYVQARFYWRVTHSRGARAYILTHLEEASRNLFGIARRFYTHCPRPLKPRVTAFNARELVFGYLDSSYRVGTAKSNGAGRSDTLQYFHGSEVAYWPQAQDHIAGILQAVPGGPGTEVILESTSAGPEGKFYQLCMEALAGNSVYQMIFVPWFWQEEYAAVSVPEGFVLTGEEEFYKQAHGLSDAQILWRRDKTAELGGSWVFRREYPSTPQEAFRSDAPGALWNRDMLDRNRVSVGALPSFRRVVVAIDPAVTARQDSDETGIIVAALGTDGHGYVLADLSGKYSPAGWAARAVAAYHEWQADRIVAEANQGGDLVAHTLKTVDTAVPLKLVHASRGKRIRAEPVAALDEQGKIHHAGLFAALEDQMCSFCSDQESTASPDRMDARVWALSELMLARKSDGPVMWRG